MAGSDNKPTMRVIAKMTDSGKERFSDLGVAWNKKGEDGRNTISIKFNPFVNGDALIKASVVLLVPFERDRGEGRGGGAPNPNDSPPPDDNDAPGW